MTSIWDSVFKEFSAAAAIPRGPGERTFWADLIESKIKRVSELSGRPLVVYASACTIPAGKGVPELLQIDYSDKIGFRSVLENLDGRELDIIIHSPGGFAEPTESIVEEIRHKFDFVRFIVPSYAKSAATMMAMSGDQILMDEDAELGPIDPQMSTRNGVVAADAIRQQYVKATEAILGDPKMAQVWFPILQMLGPGLLAQCDNAETLAKNLVIAWLTKYMCRADSNCTEKAKAVAEYLSNHKEFKSHGRRVKLEQLRRFELAVFNLRDNPTFYQAVWELYCMLDIMLTNTPAFKIFYNSANTAMVRNNVQGGGIQLIPMPQLPQPLKLAPTPAPSGAAVSLPPAPTPLTNGPNQLILTPKEKSKRRRKGYAKPRRRS